MQLTLNNMKKLITLLLCFLMLTGCHSNDASLKLYNEMIEILTNSDDYSNTSKYFTITYETTLTNDGLRYYIVIDNPLMAMYDVNVIAFEEGADTDNEFAPNAGIFDEEINLVPNQINIDMGYAKGISISGLCTDESKAILCLVQWKDENNSKVYREYLKLNKSQD